MRTSFPRSTTQDCLSLDIRQAVRCRFGAWAGARLVTHNDRGVLTVSGLNAVRLVQTVPHFGGRRWWALCPQCARRVAILYLPRRAQSFGCRVCLGLVHASTRETLLTRAICRVQALRRRYGLPANLGIPIERPWGMWRRTFACLAERERLLMAGVNVGVGAWIEGTNGRRKKAV